MNTENLRPLPPADSPPFATAAQWGWCLGSAAVLAILICASGCMSELFAAATPAAPMTIRIENATASTVTVVVEVLDEFGNLAAGVNGSGVDIPVVTVGSDSVSFGVLPPTGAGAAAAEITGDSLLSTTQATVRVSGFQVSEGVVLCGDILRLTATLGTTTGSSTTVALRGDGSGTPSFDNGSIGEAGVRFLVRGTDFTCGQSAVLRMTDDGTGTGAGSTGNAVGEIAVVNAGAASPFGMIETPTGTGTSDETEIPTTVRVQIENLGNVLSTTNLTIGTGEDQQTFEVTVPPLTTSAGAFACGTQFSLLARYPNPESVDDQSTEALVILTGDGTGSPGFDRNSVARDGERILILGTHVECGDLIRVTLRDDVEPIGFQGIGVLGGTVTVVSGSE